MKPSLAEKLTPEEQVKLLNDTIGLDDISQEPYRTTDLGNARRLVDRFGFDIRYCPAWKKWLVFDGRRWKIDATQEINRIAVKTIGTLYAEAAAAMSATLRREISRHAIRSESLQRLRAMVELAGSIEGMPVLPEELDENPWLLAVNNGTIDLKTGKLLEHSRGDLITKLAAVDYDPAAECPTWLSFLDRIMAGNGGLKAFLQLAVGYSATGNTSEQVLFILHGNGANGKTTFLNTIGKLLGDYAMQTPCDTLMAREHGGIRNDIARLKGARFVAAVEAEEGNRLAESQIKQMTGNDKLTARFMWAEFFEFLPNFKIWLATNHKPTIKGTDHAIWRRIRLIPFNVRIPDDQQDKNLPGKLEAELPGILNWAVEGCLAWQNIGLPMPAEVSEATEVYRREMDGLEDFLEERCIVKPYAKVPASKIYEAYRQWCDANGEKVEDQRNFGRKLTEKGFTRTRGTAGRHLWEGICLAELAN